MTMNHTATQLPLEDFAREEVHFGLSAMMYQIGARLRREGILEDQATADLVANEVRRSLASAVDDPEAFSIQAEWLTTGNCFGG